MRQRQLLALSLIALLGNIRLSTAKELAYGAGDVVEVEIDILPGETRNIVDPASADAVPVAILGSLTLDAASIDPTSLRLAGAAVVKDA